MGRKLAIDPAGNYHVVYHTVDEWKVFYVRSEDDGLTWSTPVQLSTGTLAASGAVIDIGQSAPLHVAWVNRTTDGDKRIYYTRFIAGSGWEAPRDLSGPLGMDCAGASLVVDPNDHVHLAWHIGDAAASPYLPSEAARVYYTRSLDGGSSFEMPRRISSITGYHAAWPRFKLAGGDGDVIAFAWRDNRNDPDWDVYVGVSADSGATFAERVVSADPTDKEWDPEAAIGPLGTLHVTYSKNPGPNRSVNYRRSTNLGVNWSSETTLSTDLGIFSSFGYAPATSTLWVWWKDERDAANQDTTKADVITRYSQNAGLTWSDPEFVTDLGDLDTRFPSMATTPDGRPVVQWADLRNGTSEMFMKARETVTGIPPAALGPTHGLVLEEPYPNPMNSRTVIAFNVAAPQWILLRIVSADGRLVKTLVSGQVDTGFTHFTWERTDFEGNRVPSGVYFAVLEGGGELLSRKLVVLR